MAVEMKTFQGQEKKAGEEATEWLNEGVLIGFSACMSPNGVVLTIVREEKKFGSGGSSHQIRIFSGRDRAQVAPAAADWMNSGRLVAIKTFTDPHGKYVLVGLKLNESY